MKLFTIEEANSLLASVRPIVRFIQKSHHRVAAFNGKANHASQGAELGGGGMVGGEQYAQLLTQLSAHTEELESLGIQLKDYRQGLIDFPSMRDGRVVLLCWRLDEGDRIAWWHEVEAGFAGRQPI